MVNSVVERRPEFIEGQAAGFDTPLHGYSTTAARIETTRV